MVMSQHVLVNRLTNFQIPIQMRRLQELLIMVRVLCINVLMQYAVILNAIRVVHILLTHFPKLPGKCHK